MTALMLSAAPTLAAPISSTGYSFDHHADCGDYCYYDAGIFTPSGTPYVSGGGELTDGRLGYAGWSVASTGPTVLGADPWVGWYQNPVVNIDFTFAGAQTFDSVSVGTTQDTIYDVVLPNLRVFSSMNGVDWILRGGLNTAVDGANDRNALSTAPHVFLTISGLNFTAPYVRLEVSNHSGEPHSPAYGRFSFIDEVRFDGTRSTGSDVPEPASWAMMLVGFFGMGALLRNRRRLLSV